MKIQVNGDDLATNPKHVQGFGGLRGQEFMQNCLPTKP